MQLEQLPKDDGSEIAFAGRSNAGKSSALNAITNIKGLARTSKTPGRTQSINIFQVTEKYRLVDLPGYGYAEVPLAMKRQWGEILREYLQTRASLKGLCVIMDIRHPLQPLDQDMTAWALSAQLPIHILLSKADKLSRGASLKVITQVKKYFQGNPLLTCQAFSAISGDGVLPARKQLSQWLT